MRSAPFRRTLPITAAALMAAFLLSSAQAGAAGPPARLPVPPSLALRARITGAVIPVDGGRTANGDPGLGRVLAAASGQRS